MLYFPVLVPSEYPECPRVIPWALIRTHEQQALLNHCGQSLRRLAERGGLSPRELYAVLHDRKIDYRIPDSWCVEFLMNLPVA